MSLSLVLPLVLAGTLAGANGGNQSVELFADLPPLEIPNMSGVVAMREYKLYRASLDGLSVNYPATQSGAVGGGTFSWSYENHVEKVDSGSRFLLNNLGISLGFLLPDYEDTTSLSYQSGVSFTAIEYDFRTKLSEVQGLPMFLAATAGIYGGTFTLQDMGNGIVKSLSLPLSLSAGVAIGRILPVDTRVAVSLIENMLMNDGVISEALPRNITNQIVAMWYGHRNELGAEQRIINVAQILAKAGLLKGPLNAATAYRLERLTRRGITSFTTRYSGNETRVLIRAGNTFSGQEMADSFETNLSDATFAIEMRNRSVYNLSSTADFWFEPAAGFAPRAEDRTGNTLPGHTRVGIFDNGVGSAFSPNGMFILDFPVTFSQLFYDDFYNASGLARLHAGTSVGYNPDNTEAFRFALNGGASYQVFTTGADSWTVGLHATLPYLNGAFQPDLQIIANYQFGTGDDFYTAPDALGDSEDLGTQRLKAGE